MSVFFLTQLKPAFHFYNPWKRQKTLGFLMFSGCIEMEHWAEMDLHGFHETSFLHGKLQPSPHWSWYHWSPVWISIFHFIGLFYFQYVLGIISKQVCFRKYFENILRHLIWKQPWLGNKRLLIRSQNSITVSPNFRKVNWALLKIFFSIPVLPKGVCPEIEVTSLHNEISGVTSPLFVHVSSQYKLMHS